MKILRSFVSAALVAAAVPAWAKLQVVATTQDLAAIAAEVAGDAADVQSIAKGYQDPHFVDAKPSHLLKLRKADLFIQVGLELEIGWAPSLLAGARNPKVLPGAAGFLEAAEGCEILQKPAGQVDRSMGDVHPLGNPHFWLDPENGRRIARRVAERLAQLDAVNAGTYRANLAAFESKLDAKEKEWAAATAGRRLRRVVTYHNSWPNFAKAFGIEIVNFVEPKPGVPPSPAHVQALTAQMKAEKVPLILVEPYFDAKLPEKIAADSGARVLVFPPSVGARPDVQTYFDLFDVQLKLLSDAAGGRP